MTADHIVKIFRSPNIHVIEFSPRSKTAGPGPSGIRTGYRFGQSDGRDLPGQSPFVLAPAARTLFAAVADDRVPITISFGLVSGCDLKRERFVVLECGSAIEPEAGNPHHDKLYRQ